MSYVWFDREAGRWDPNVRFVHDRHTLDHRQRDTHTHPHIPVRGGFDRVPKSPTVQMKNMPAVGPQEHCAINLDVIVAAFG